MFSGFGPNFQEHSIPSSDEPRATNESLPRFNSCLPSPFLLPETRVSHIETLHQNFVLAVRNGGSRNFLGTRPVTNGIAGPFIWQTYNEVYKRVKNMASGLLTFPEIDTADPVEPINVGIFSLNRAEWIIAEQSCHMLSLPTIPLFDMLSTSAITHILSLTSPPVIFASLDKCNVLFGILSDAREITCVKRVIIIDVGRSNVSGMNGMYGGGNLEAVEEVKEWGRFLGVEVFGFGDVEVLGALRLARITAGCDDDRADGEITDLVGMQFSRCCPNGDSIATICFTSGTTGIPKGVVLTHTNMLTLMKGMYVLEKYGRFTGVTADDIYLSYLPLAHVFERTMTVILISACASIGFFQGDTLKLMDDVAELRPTIFSSVPRVYNRMYDKVKTSLRTASKLHEMAFSAGYEAKRNLLVANGNLKHFLWDTLVFAEIREKLGGRVRMMLTGAAPISRNVTEFLRVCFGAEVVEGYGLTETCSCLTVTGGLDNTPDQVGAPVPGTLIKLMDVPEMNYFTSATPARGEICVKGPNVFRAYYKDPIETNAVLDEDGWFRTGDIGEWDSCGRLRLVDRKKSIFKLSQGEYIAPEKIEGVLKRHELVSQAFIYGDSFKSCIVAIIVPDRPTFMSWCTQTQGHSFKSFAALCGDPEIRHAFLQVLDRHGKTHGLKGFENVKAVYLESDGMTVTVENGLLTPLLKLKRFAATKFYEKEIEEMYRGLGM